MIHLSCDTADKAGDIVKIMNINIYTNTNTYIILLIIKNKKMYHYL